MPKTPLGEYREKRDFRSTPEPRGAKQEVTAGPLTFVVHRHDARRLHYDLRIECDGVLLSFAIPRGPSATVGDRRLAVRTEDHPLDYAAFEGVIPTGQYGAGTSIIWDAGTYAPDDPQLLFDKRQSAEAAVRAGLEDGKLSLTFRGRKLKGSWALVRTGDGWLLIKHRDAMADPAVPLTERTRSVLSGRTNADLLHGDHGAVKQGPAHFAPQSVEGSRRTGLEVPSPMLAAGGKTIPARGWTYEPKLDGIRVLACLEDGQVQLVSRSGQDITAVYPGVARAVKALPATSLLLDGEIVAHDGQGRLSFELLQRRMNLQDSGEIDRAEAAIPVACYLFDILHLDGYGLTGVPIEARREVLARVLLPGNVLREVAVIDLPPRQAFETAVGHGFEGIIAKRDGSRYAPGHRSDSWRKWKALGRAVYSVGGYTRGEGSRASTFGSLLLGEPTPTGLVYRGRVGTGFSDAMARELRSRLDRLRRDHSPFVSVPAPVQGLTWVEPHLEVAVDFVEVTKNGVLRAPSFKGLAGGDRAPFVPPANASPSQLETSALLAQLNNGRRALTLEGDDWTLGLTNLDRVFWPGHEGRPAITKRDLLRYAIQVWPLAATHLRDRLLVATRYPGGITGEHFYQRHIDARLPHFIETANVYSESEGSDRRYILCNRLPALLYLCQQAALEWHISLSRVTSPDEREEGTVRFTGSKDSVAASVLNHPDILLFDLDSYIYRGDEQRGEEPAPSTPGFDAARSAAFALRTLLDELRLPSFVKPSGKTGLHVCVPLVRTLDFAAVRAFATTIGRELVRRHPQLFTMEWHSEKRRGKVFVDVNQNARIRAIAAPFSPRAHPGAPLSMPITWTQLESARLGSHLLDPASAPDVDAWEGFGESAVDLRSYLGIE